MISRAILNINPNAKFSIEDDSYDTIIWLSDDITKPSKQEVLEEISRLQDEYTRNKYQRRRAAEYPPVVDFLDAIVKGDDVQKQKYIDACLAVKAKYPKP